MLDVPKNNQSLFLALGVVIAAILVSGAIWSTRSTLTGNVSDVAVVMQQISEMNRNIDTRLTALEQKSSSQPASPLNVQKTNDLIAVPSSPVSAPVATTTRVGSAIGTVPSQNPTSAVLYSSNEYGFQLTTLASCAKQFSIKKRASAYEMEDRAFRVFVPLSKSWPAGEEWYSYTVMKQQVYDQIDGNALPGKPTIVKKLRSGWLITVENPQDGPADVPVECAISVVDTR